jgi:hypothetical protein
MSFVEEGTRKKNLGGVESKYAAEEEWSDKKAECDGNYFVRGRCRKRGNQHA